MLNEFELPDAFEDLQQLVSWSLVQIARPFDSSEIVKSILTGVRETTGSMRADLLLYQSDMNILFIAETVCAESEKNSARPLNIADSKNSATVEALHGGHTVVVPDVSLSGLTGFSSGARSLLSVPLVYSNNLHGVINLEHPLPDAYDDNDVGKLEEITTVLAVIVEHSFLEEKIYLLHQRVIDLLTENAGGNDPEYRAHARRVSLIAEEIARNLGLENDLVDTIKESGYLHDLGKSGVNREILVKPGALTNDEYDQVKRHPVLGRFILKPVGFRPEVIEGVLCHHERWDGDGYPTGLAGEEIPITGRILAVAEALDVMTTDQPYREKMSPASAIEEIKSKAGTQFDPEVVLALEKIPLADLLGK